MIRKLFKLWDQHTIGFCRVLVTLIFPVALFRPFAEVYSCLLLLMWLVVHTGYSKGWDKSKDKGGKP